MLIFTPAGDQTGELFTTQVRVIGLAAVPTCDLRGWLGGWSLLVRWSVLGGLPSGAVVPVYNVRACC